MIGTYWILIGPVNLHKDSYCESNRSPKVSSAEVGGSFCHNMTIDYIYLGGSPSKNMTIWQLGAGFHKVGVGGV